MSCNSGHAAMYDADFFMHRFDHGGQAVGGAGCRCHQVMLRRIVQVVVDTVDNIQRALGGRRNDDLFHALIEVGLQSIGLFMMLCPSLRSRCRNPTSRFHQCSGCGYE